MSEEQVPVFPPAENKPMKLGIKIEKPLDIKIHLIFPILLIFSFIFIGGTLWLLSIEYLGAAPPVWLRSVLENFALAI